MNNSNLMIIFLMLILGYFILYFGGRKYLETFQLLGLTEDDLSENDAVFWLDIIKEFNLVKLDNTDFIKEIVINGYTYQCYEKDKFSLSVRDLAKIENYIVKNKTEFLGEMLAIVYKRVDLTKAEHYVDAHIKHKAELFRENLTADIAIPFLMLIQNRIINSLEDGK